MGSIYVRNKRLSWWLSGKESTCQHRRCGFNPWVGKIPWRRKWQLIPAFSPRKSHRPLQYSYLGNPTGRGAWWATVHGVVKSWARLSDFTFTFHFHALEKEMATHSRFSPEESQGWGSLVGCRLWGCTESDTTEAT